MVDGADAGAEPDVGRGGAGEVRVEDDELGALQGRLEGVFAAGGVARGAGEVGVFAGGEGGRDRDDGHGGRIDGRELVGADAEFEEGVVGGDVVC